MEELCRQMVWGPMHVSMRHRDLPSYVLSAQDVRLTFVRNRGELAEGWYDPATLQKAQASAATSSDFVETRRSRNSPTYSPVRPEASSDEDLVGPTLPGQEVAAFKRSKRQGPGIPNLQDLELQRG